MFLAFNDLFHFQKLMLLLFCKRAEQFKYAPRVYKL